MAFKSLSKDIYENAISKGFYEVPPSNLERFALMHEEISEATSASRHDNPPDDHIPKFSGIEAELADTVIRIMDFSAYKNLNVAEAIIEKMEYNRGRPYKYNKNC